MKHIAVFGFIILLTGTLVAQSGRVNSYSESPDAPPERKITPKARNSEQKIEKDSDVINVETDLVVVPVRISDAKGKAVTDLRKEEFKIFQDNIEQKIAYFSDTDQPLTVALVLDMSYSSIFKLEEIQQAALTFVSLLRPEDKVAVISFDEEVRFLCEPTNNRKVLRLAIEATEISSGTSLYTALDKVIAEKFGTIPGRKGIVLFSDGVDTASKNVNAEKIIEEIRASDAPVFPLQYDTYDDVQKSRKENAQVYFDEDDRPFTVEKNPIKGERAEDYKSADEFLREIALRSGGRVYRVSSKLNLSKAFADIADELRKVYSLGYYPVDELKSGQNYSVKVRVYRSGLKIRTKTGYSRR